MGWWRPDIKEHGIGPTGTERIKVWISVLLFWWSRLPSTYEVRWGVVLDPLLGLRCVQDGWTAPHSHNPPRTSPRSLSVIWRIPWAPFPVQLLLTLTHITHTKANEVTQVSLKNSELNVCICWCLSLNKVQFICSASHIPCIRRSHGASLARWNRWATSETCCFNLFWALRGCAERPLTSVRGLIIGPVYFYCFISDASEVADGVLWPETCF